MLRKIGERKKREMKPGIIKGLIDTHCHLTDKKYKNESIELIIKNAKESGIRQMITVGVNMEDSKKALLLATEYSNLYSSYGLHPSEIVNGKKISEKDIMIIKKRN